MNLSGMMEKKIGPVPVLYIVAGAVLIFAVVAFKMKPSPSADPTTSDTPKTDPYDSLETTGTVIAPTVSVPQTPQRPTDNDAWIREGATWLSTNKGVSPTAAYNALSKYINGQSRSIEEGRWVDWVIAEKGYPPDPFTDSPLPATPSTGGTSSSNATTKPGRLPWPSTPPTIPDATPLAPVVPIRPRPTVPYTR